MSGHGGEIAVLGVTLAISALCPLGCGRPRVEAGSTLRLHYTLSVEGAVVESTVGREPATVALSDPAVPPGLREGLVGLRAGEQRAVLVPPEKGYGPRDSAAVRRVPRERFGSEGAKLEPGAEVQGLQDGRAATARVVAVGQDEVTLDFNHPLAGKTLRYETRVVEVR